MTDSQQDAMVRYHSDSIGSGISSLSDIGKIFVKKDDGNVVLNFGYVVSLFFLGGSTHDRRQSLNEVFFSYLDLFPAELTHTYNFATHRMNRPLRTDTKSYFISMLSDFSSEDIYSVSAARVEDPGNLALPTPYFIMGLASDTSTKLSFVDMYLPTDWVERRGYEELRGLVLLWCNFLRPLHGTCGLGTIFAPSTGRGSEGAAAFPFLKRFPGLDYNDSIRWLIRTERTSINCIRTINWLTVIDDSLVSMLDGKDTITRRLGRHCPIYPYDGGLVIQAGDRPQLGDINKGDVPEPYKAVANVLNPLVFKEYDFDLLDVPQPLDGREETKRWISRFDR